MADIRVARWQDKNIYIQPIKDGFQVSCKYIIGNGSFGVLREKLIGIADSIGKVESPHTHIGCAVDRTPDVRVEIEHGSGIGKIEISPFPFRRN